MKNTCIKDPERLLLKKLIGKKISQIYYDGIFFYLFSEDIKLICGPEPTWVQVSKDQTEELMRFSINIFTDIHSKNLENATPMVLKNDELILEGVNILNANLKLKYAKDTPPDVSKYSVQFLKLSELASENNYINIDIGLSFIFSSGDKIKVATDGDGYKTYFIDEGEVENFPHVELPINS